MNHGTAVASVAAGRGTELIKGVAPFASLANYRIFNVDKRNSKYILEGIKTSGLKYSIFNKVDIINNSWGISTNHVYEDKNIVKWIRDCTKYGRNGRGILSIWASGNSGFAKHQDGSADYSTFDYVLNMVSTIVVSSMFYKYRSLYSESGSNVLCCAPGGQYVNKNNDFRLLTASIIPEYNGDYVSKEQGTSFSAPIISGCCALLLGIRPDLTWRDVKEIISLSCKVLDINNLSETYFNTDTVVNPWIINGDGRNYNINFGYGLIDAFEMMSLGVIWKNLPPSLSLRVSGKNRSIVKLNSNKTNFEFVLLDDSFNKIEHVQVWLTLTGETSYIYDLGMSIQSPSGTKINCFDSDGDTQSKKATYVKIDNYPICAECFRGENPEGKWIVSIWDDNPTTLINLTKIDLHVDGYRI